MDQRPTELSLPAPGNRDAVSVLAADILAEARAALAAPPSRAAAAVHDYRKAMKRWRALLRLIEPFFGEAARDLRIEARDLARGLAGARDLQSALDALDDLAKVEGGGPPKWLAAARGYIEEIKRPVEQTTLTDAARARLRGAVDAAAATVGRWGLDSIAFDRLARELARGYRRARRSQPDDWAQAGADELHALRQRVVVHRYQMELAAPLWPRLGKVWVGEAQRLREHLGAHQDLVVLSRLSAPRQPLARERARLAPLIADRQAAHVAAARRLAGRLFAERPKAFRRRLEALWANHCRNTASPD